MSAHQDDKTGTESEQTPEVTPGGTAAGSPVEGAEIGEQEAERAVTPSEDAFEAEGPQAGHA